MLKHLQEFVVELNNLARKSQIAIALVCMLIGFLLVTQLKTNQSAAQALREATESDLSQLVGNLKTEISTLKAENLELKLRLFQMERVNHDSSTIMRESYKTFNNLRIIAGLTAVSGQGIVVQLSDRNRVLNANDLVDIITELRVGGAEAVSVNGIRVVADTGLMQSSRGIFVETKLISPPYEILAIGEPSVLYEALAIAGGVRDKLSSLSGVTFKVKKDDDVRITALSSKDEGAK